MESAIAGLAFVDSDQPVDNALVVDMGSPDEEADSSLLKEDGASPPSSESSQTPALDDDENKAAPVQRASPVLARLPRAPAMRERKPFQSGMPFLPLKPHALINSMAQTGLVSYSVECITGHGRAIHARLRVAWDAHQFLLVSVPCREWVIAKRGVMSAFKYLAVRLAKNIPISYSVMAQKVSYWQFCSVPVIVTEFMKDTA
jgi:hypothetical protein